MNQKFHFILSFLIIILNTNLTFGQKVVRYELHVNDTIVNFTGKNRHAIAVNGQIPMPDLTFTEGDTAEIVVYNELDEPTSLHWHGLYVPNQEDGVPYLTQMPIPPHSTYTYRFPIIQSGTHWYHSHFELQEQIGMYGSLILKKRQDDPSFRSGIDDLTTIPVVLSEWTDMKPEKVHRLLHTASDWFAIKKGTTQSYGEAIKSKHFKTKVVNEWKRMLAMDVSDVYYDKFLMNGKNKNYFPDAKPGEKIRLRISNGGASSYFWLTYSGGKITVVANDGNDVVPVEVDRLIIGVSETYDVIVTIPENGGAYEFLATSEDRIGSASLLIGTGMEHFATPLPRLDYFAGMDMMNGMMKMNGDMYKMKMSMELQKMDMNKVMYPELKPKEMKMDAGMDMDHSMNMSSSSDGKIVTLNYGMLKSPTITSLPENAPVHELKFELTGNMNRYVWSLDNKVISESDKILIKKGENVRIVLYNNSMMRHPMHLHGHDFRVLNGEGDYAPLQNVLDILPMETDRIEFSANAEGDWFFHCHILYHMMSGMGRVISYENQESNPLILNPKKTYRKFKRDANGLHLMANNDIATNGNDGMAMLQNTRWSLGTEWRLGYNDMHGYETETHFGRYIGKMQWFMPFVGFDWRYRRFGMDEVDKNVFGQANSKDNRSLMSLGFNFTLPMLFILQGEVFHDGTVRFQLMREDIPITKRLRAGVMVNSDLEYMVDLRYIITKNIGVRTHYDSDMGFGVGLSLNY